MWVWEVEPRILKSVSVVLLILILILSHVSSAQATTIQAGLKPGYSRAYISSILMSEDFWKHGAYVEDSALLSFTPPESQEFKIISRGEFGQVIIVLDKSTSQIVLKGKVLGVVAVLPTHIYNVVIAVIARDQLPKLASTPGVLAVLPDIRLDVLINKERKELSEIVSNDPLLAEILQTSNAGSGDFHYTVEITGAYDVWTQYGVRGEETRLAIIDTGVDYGSPGLGLEAIARDEYGLPLIFDASSLGLVLTPVEGVDLGNGYIYINASNLYVFYPPYYVLKWTNSLYAYASCGPSSLWLTFPDTWYIGDIPHYGAVKFGLAFQTLSLPIGNLVYTIPIILVDSNGDRYYDTLYADTTTALYLVRNVTSRCGITIPGSIGTSPDFSFGDEEPITYGNEVIARDLDGDGIRDYSVGALAGYVYDSAFVIILEKIGVWKELMSETDPLYGYSTADVIMYEMWNYEPVAVVWPGLDQYGDYVVIEYDYHSHGTFCANTAAGRDFYAQTGYGVKSISGQAPAAKIAAAPALYFGTVAVSIYFFSGFDIVTPYGIGSRYLWPNLLVNPWIAFGGLDWSWVYTGEHQVDITSNSYGASGWALWGWNTGADPNSVIFDYTILTSGTMHFVAVGNGGPGYGTVSTPASSSLSISVGAATEFTYRPLYGYRLPGSSREVISWSNRGPTEIGVVKPDVVAVGSFAWAIGRTWDALGNVYGVRNLTGRLAYNLFSGTSQATPMAAGVGALVVSAYKSAYGSRMAPYLLKTILMNNAKDMGFDELSQGAGFVNAYGAVTAVLDSSYPKVYSKDLINDVFAELGLNYAAITYGESAGYAGTWYEPKIFVPLVKYSATRTLIVEGTGTYRVYPARLESVGVIPLCNIMVKTLDTPIVGCSGDTILLNVTGSTVYGHVMLNTSALLNYDFFEIEAIYPYEYFEAGGRQGNYTLRIPTSILELAYWVDYNKDGLFSWLETGRISYDIRRANALRIQIGKLGEKLNEIEALTQRYMSIDVSGLTKSLVLRLGVSGSTYRGVLPVEIRVTGYKLVPWTQVKTSPSYLTLSDGSRSILVSIRKPSKPGFYSGYIVVEELNNNLKYLVPVSFFVPLEITSEKVYRIYPYTENTPRKNTYLRGAFDYSWRYESGDWRVFKVVVGTGLRYIWALGVRVTWPTYDNLNYASNLDVQVYGPYTYYMVDYDTYSVYSYRVNSVQLAAELTIDPTRSSSYNPTRFWDAYMPGESFIIAPATSPGVYRVVVRNIQFRGTDYTEPFTIEVFPVTLRAMTHYYRTIKTITVTLSIKTPLYAEQVLPLELMHNGEAIYNTTTGLAYIPSLLEKGVLVDATIVTRDTTAKTLTANITIQYEDATPKGTYIIPVSALLPVAVTSIGWLEGGAPYPYFEHYEIPIISTVRIY